MKLHWMVLLLPATGLTPSAAAAQRPADAYLDEDAHELVRLARVRRSTVELLGAREVAPPIKAEAQVPFEIDEYVPHLAFDPGNPEVLVRFDTTVVRHPLLEGSEAHYRFESGDTTAIRLPDGSSVRLRELRVLPRRRDPHLVNGSFWLETETHAVVHETGPLHLVP